MSYYQQQGSCQTGSCQTGTYPAQSAYPKQPSCNQQTPPAYYPQTPPNYYPTQQPLPYYPQQMPCYPPQPPMPCYPPQQPTPYYPNYYPPYHEYLPEPAYPYPIPEYSCADGTYLENILCLNKGKLACVYMTFENSSFGSKIFKGVIEAAGHDYIILCDSTTNTRYLLLKMYLNYITFEEEVICYPNYGYPYNHRNDEGK